VGLLGPCGAFTESRRPLTFPSSPAGTPESESDVRPICCPIITFLADCDADLNLRARGPCFALPVRARRAKARERLLSCREPASRNPQAVHAELLKDPRVRAPFRLLPIRAPRQAGLRTSSWLAPSRVHQQALRPPGGEDARCVQPMSATHTNYVHPHLARSRLALAAFAAWTPHGV
jgi:hypothetical protein